MVDINAPVNPELNNPATPVTPSQAPMAANTAAAPADASVMPPQPKKSKTKLMLLVILVLVGLGYVYYTYFMNSDETPSVTVFPETTMTGDSMMNTGDAMMSGDMTSTGDLDALLGTGGDNNVSAGNADLDEDMQRQADLQEISMALALYREEHGNFPSLKDYASGVLMYINTIPVDPLDELWPSFNNAFVSGYVYSPLYRNNRPNGGALIMARTLTAEGSNRVDADPALSKINDIAKADAAKIESMVCDTITMNETTIDSLSDCTAALGSENLRYVSIQ